MKDLRDKKILVGVTGGIAPTRWQTLIELLVKAGAEVKVVMTPSLKVHHSVTLSTLSGNPVYSEFFNERTGG